jgi:hypothetical protein
MARWVAALALLLCCPLGACTSWRTAPVSGLRAVALSGRETVRITRTNTSVLVLRHAQVQGDSVVGEAGSPPQRVAVATNEIQRLDVRKVSATRTTGLSLGVLAVVSVVAVGAALAAVLGGWH